MGMFLGARLTTQSNIGGKRIKDRTFLRSEIRLTSERNEKKLRTHC